MVSQPSCWRLSPRISSSRLATSSPRPGRANNSLVTRVLISAFLSYLGLSIAGGGVPGDDEGDDLAVADGEVAGQDQLVRQVRLVVVAVVAAADDGVAVVVDDVGYLDGHPVADDLAGNPAANRRTAPEFPVRVVNQGILGEGGHDGVLVEGVEGGHILGQHGAQGGGVGHVGSLFEGLLRGDDSTLGAPFSGGSTGHSAIDSPATGGSTMTRAAHSSGRDAQRTLLIRQTPVAPAMATTAVAPNRAG